MRDANIKITDHGKTRWIDGTCGNKTYTNIDAIRNKIKESVMIPKDELLPFGITRINGTVYSFHEKDRLLFVFEPLGFNTFRLITILSKNFLKIKAPLKSVKNNLRFKRRQYVNTEQVNTTEDKEWLIEEKRRLATEISSLHKKDTRRKELNLQIIQLDNKIKGIKNQKIEPQKSNGLGNILNEILVEVKELKRLINEKLPT